MIEEQRRASVRDTDAHVCEVAKVLLTIVSELYRRVNGHDASKKKQPELDVFAVYGPKLTHTTYGSAEYKRNLEEMGAALAHHYANNRHHPEHFEDGVRGMNLVDLIEMVADWKAATMRHADGDIRKSMEINAKRFGITGQLLSVLQNTVAMIENAAEQKPDDEPAKPLEGGTNRGRG